jgi:hypothetical protein
MSTLEIDVGDLRPRSVAFTSDELVVTLADGRKTATPLEWYPRLMCIHWPDIDEDLSIAGILKGQRE